MTCRVRARFHRPHTEPQREQHNTPVDVYHMTRRVDLKRYRSTQCTEMKKTDTGVALSSGGKRRVYSICVQANGEGRNAKYGVRTNS